MKGQARTAWIGAALCLVPGLLLGPAAAADREAGVQARPAKAKNTLYATIGVDLRTSPVFEGSDKLRFVPIPTGYLGMGPPSGRFTSFKDSPSFGLIDTGVVRAGPAIGFRFPRYQSEAAALRGRGAIGFALEPGVFVEVEPTPWLRARAELRHGIGAHEGILADFMLDAHAEIAPGWRLSAGPRLSWAGADFARRYFGVTPAQSLASGQPVFRPGDGFRSYGVGGALQWRVSPQVLAMAYVEYDRLTGDIGESPLVRGGSRDQVLFGLRITYTFDTGLEPPF